MGSSREVIKMVMERGAVESKFFKVPVRNVNEEVILVNSPLESTCILVVW